MNALYLEGFLCIRESVDKHLLCIRILKHNNSKRGRDSVTLCACTYVTVKPLKTGHSGTHTASVDRDRPLFRGNTSLSLGSYNIAEEMLPGFAICYVLCTIQFVQKTNLTGSYVLLDNCVMCTHRLSSTRAFLDNKDGTESSSNASFCQGYQNTR